MAKWKLKEGATWRLKLTAEHPNHGKIVRIPPKMRNRLGTGTMLIPRPLDVDAAMRRVRKGRLMTQSQLRAVLAHAAGADTACPMTTGIFIRMAAEAAEEDALRGRKRITPYWRTIKDDGRLNDNYPGGAKSQARRLRDEGLCIEASKGVQPPRVRDFEKRLIAL